MASTRSLYTHAFTCTRVPAHMSIRVHTHTGLQTCKFFISFYLRGYLTSWKMFSKESNWAWLGPSSRGERSRDLGRNLGGEQLYGKETSTGWWADFSSARWGVLTQSSLQLASLFKCTYQPPWMMRSCAERGVLPDALFETSPWQWQGGLM